MERIKVLHIGIKNYPYDSAYSDIELAGLRGGGMNKYCNILINSTADEVESYLIVQKLANQLKYEKNESINIYRVGTFGSRRIRQIIATVKSFFLAIKLIRKNNIKIVHGHMIHGILISYLLTLIFRIKLVGTPYSFVVKGFPRLLDQLSRYIEQKIYKRIDTIIFETPGNLQIAKEFRDLHLNNTKVIYTGIDIPKLNNSEATEHRVKFYYIGRIVKIKALDNLINGIELLPRTIKDQINFDLIGEGDLLDEYRNQIVSRDLTEIITFHGFVKDATSFFENSDIFILPSHMEGLSISLLEAMSFGKACIVNDFGLPFSSDVVYTMENNRAESIAEAITYFVENRKIIKELGENARKTIINNFSIKAFSDNHVEVYRKLFYN